MLLDLPFDVQMTEIDFDPDTYQPLPVYKPAATRAQVEKALDMLAEAERPLIVAGGGIINADAAELLVQFAEITGVPVVPTLMGWGIMPDDHELMAGMVGPADVAPLRQRDHARVRLRARHRQPVRQPAHRRHRHLPRGRKFIHVDIEPTQIGRVFAPDYSIVSDAKAALELFVQVAQERADALRLPDRGVWAKDCAQRKQTLQRRTHFDNIPIKPQRVYEEMNRAFGRDTRYVSTIGLSQIAGAQFLHVYKPRHWINCGQAGPLGLDDPGDARRLRGRPGLRPWSRCRATTTSSS